MSRIVVYLVVAAAGCAASAHDPRLDAIAPATVTSLVETPAVVHGAELDAVVQLDLDTNAPAGVDRGWQLRIDALPIATPIWRDRETLELTIPRGLAAGMHDVIAISPSGLELVLPQGLAVTDEPIGLALSIEDAPGGAGQPIGGMLIAGEELTAFAVVRDPQQTFIADVAVAWDTTNAIGTLTGGVAAQVLLTATTVGTARITAHQAGASLDAETADLSVIAGAATRIAIADAPGGTGTVIGDRSGLTTDADGGLVAHAIAYDAFDNYAGAPVMTWSLTGVTGTLPATSTTTASIDFTTPGSGVLHATHATLGAASTGRLDVAPGRAAALSVNPSTLSLTADDLPATFTATATDGDGNATTNLGTLTWSIASGPITSIDPNTGALDPRHSGSGAVGVTSSLGPAAQSGAIVITAGAPTALAIAPPGLTVSADAAATQFTATALDGDGNATATGVLAWSIASGPISTIGAATGVFDPRAAGTGTIAATSALGPSGTVPVTVIPGRAASLVATPNSVDVVEGSAVVPFAVTASDGDGNPTSDLGTIVWSVSSGPITAIASATGDLTPTTAGTGTIRATSSYGATDDTGAIRIRRTAKLTASLAVPAQVTIGQTFAVTMTVTNIGEDAAANVTPCALALGGTGAATIDTSPSPLASLAAGAGTLQTWSLTATTAGSLSLMTCASATDVTTGAPTTASGSTTTTVLLPTQLAASIASPSLVGRGATFTVTMIVTNTGQITATGVVPSALTATGSGAATLSASPSGGASIAPGGTATFSWSYVATSVGSVQLHGGATDGTVTSPAAVSNITDIVESYVVTPDPFGDGTPFGFVAGYQGKVYVGPNATGTAAFRMTPDGANPEPLSFLFARDVTGSKADNTSLAPYTSLGALGCTKDTAACGPDNENQRGLFTAVTIAGTEWLIASGAKTAEDAAYLYMTTATGTNLGFHYLDLNALTASDETAGMTALGAVGNRLYLGFGAGSGHSATLYALTTQPSAPGLDATAVDLIDMRLDRLPRWQGTTTPENVDAIASLGGIAYVATKNAWVRSNVTSPGPMQSLCIFPLVCDWVDITPSTAAYTTRTSRATAKAGQLEPPDRAVPQIATFGGRMFVARNTTVGPQLWSCPTTNSKCDSGDWSLVARNSTGDVQLSQFNDPSLTSVTMLVATSSYLYIGFDSANGLQVFRTANPAAVIRGDFEGTNGCSAAAHPGSCDGYGGVGLGNPSQTRIFDGKALTFGSSSAVWMTIGNGAAPLALVMLP
jgi:hypothetical protein